MMARSVGLTIMLWSVSLGISAKDNPEQTTHAAETTPTVHKNSPPRVSLLAGYQVSQGNLKDILPQGVETRLAFDLPLGQRLWPALRVELGYVGYGALQGATKHSVTGMAWSAGLVWFMPSLPRQKGNFIGGLLTGTLAARIQGPDLDTQSNLILATALLGYEYSFGPVLLFIQARAGYLADQRNPLMSAGGVLGIARPLFDL